MPTDKERYKKLLTETGVAFSEDDPYYSEGPNLVIPANVKGHGDHEQFKNTGYTAFFNVIEFDEEGKLTAFGIWE